MKVFIQTLGCKVNQYETQAMETLLKERGHTISLSEADCDTYIINTCAVTAESGRKSRQAVRHLKAQNPDAVVGVCGCFSQISPEDVLKLGADLVSGSGNRHGFIDDLERVYNEKTQILNVDTALKRRTFEPLPAGKMEGRTRAMLKIEDGCDNFCSYCIIPYARGPVRSLPIAEAVKETEKLADEGFKELIVTGIEIASYGKDLKDKPTLTDAVCAISKKAGDMRLRLGSLEPRIITEDFCRRISELTNVCSHFHLSLQSGCDATLQRMRRKYDTARFYDAVTLLRRFFPGCGITADLIVGFPGETEEEFCKTLEFIKKCAFSSMHIFPYSRRPGTVADAMADQIEKSEKHRRAKIAAKAAAETENAFLQSCVGTVQQVLFEQEKDGFSYGHCENYCEVRVKGENMHNAVLNVQINDICGTSLLGNVIL